MANTRYDGYRQSRTHIFTFPIENHRREHVGEMRITVDMDKTPKSIIEAIQKLKWSKEAGSLFRFSDMGHLVIPPALHSVTEKDCVIIEVKYTVYPPIVQPYLGLLARMAALLTRPFRRR